MCLTQVQKNVNILSSPSITTSLYILVPHKYIANDHFQSNNIFSSPRYALVLSHVLSTLQLYLIIQKLALGPKVPTVFWNLSFYWIVHLLTTYKLTICQSAQVIIYSLPIPLWILWKRQIFHSMKSHILHSPSFHTVSLANPNIFCPVGLLLNHIIFCFFYYMPKMMMIREQ